MIMKEYLFLGIRFIDCSIDKILFKLRYGGLVVVPAAPALVTFDRDKKYHQALKDADIAIFDSGFLCILVRIFHGIKVKKFSGLEFLKNLISYCSDNAEETVFLVNTTEDEAYKNKIYLESKNVSIKGDYIAPMYGDNIEDQNLVKLIKENKPKYVIINLGGGVQEVLGSFIKKETENCAYKPIVICTGAAIAFLTGSQAKIPTIIDRIYLGWLARCIYNPKVFVPRYLGGFNLIWLVMKNKIRKIS